MIQIKPVQFPLNKGTATTFTLSVLQFYMDAVTATFYYQLSTNEGFCLDQGNISMTEQEFIDWGIDNQYCIDWALNKLGLEKAII
jgi:hypothetical protein